MTRTTSILFFYYKFIRVSIYLLIAYISIATVKIII